MPYEKDANGIWWYRNSIQRSRAGKYVCEKCGKSFYRIKTNPHKFCSKICSNEVTAGIHKITRRGKGNPQWKGGRNVVGGGYIRVYIPGHPYADKIHKTVLEHRLVMEKKLGRYLFPYETVHHKNGIRSDNKIKNLELFISKHPPGQRVNDLIVYAKWILKNYKNVRV